MDRPSRPPGPLQPAVDHLDRRAAQNADDEVDVELLEELGAFQTLDAAQRLERIAEHEIMTLLQLQSFDPATPEWRTLANALVEYGYAVFMGWTISGVVRQMAANHGRGSGVLGLSKVPEGLRLDQDDAHALVVELITTSVEAFRTKTLMNPKRTWRPAGGASLKTYFVGRTLMELPDAYQRWRRSERTPLGSHIIVDLLHGDDPAEHAAGVARIRELVRDPLTRVMFELQAEGYSLAEIADMLTAAGHPQTEGSVRTRMTRARAYARAH